MTESGKPRVAIVGAGFAGLVAATCLQQAGFEILVFDKGRSVGGRLASRTRDEYQFDYGAQFFTAKDPEFKNFLGRLKQEGRVQLWTGNFGVLNDLGKIEATIEDKARMVATPAMRSLAESIVMEHTLNVFTETKITAIRKIELEGKVHWSLETEKANVGFSESQFQYLILNMPPTQAQELWTERSLQEYCMTPCLAVMISFADRLPLPFDGIEVKQSDAFFSWLARDSSKPGRPPGEHWVLHLATGSSESLWQEKDEVIVRRSLSRLSELAPLPEHTFQKVHRWRYALSQNDTKANCSYIFDEHLNLGYCGGWLHCPRIEGAHLSGRDLARAISEKQLGSSYV